MDPFESSSMVHSGATGLADDWRGKIEAPYSATSFESPALELQTPDHKTFPHSQISSTSMASVSPLSSLSVRVFITHLLFGNLKFIIQFDDAPLPTFTLPRIEKGTKVYPGIKDLPLHIRQNFRNEFIRFVIKQVANSQSPWVNLDVNSLQTMYQIVYPIFHARIRHSDAVYHPVGQLSPTTL